MLVENWKWKGKEARQNIPASSTLSDSITTNELFDAIHCLKNGKAPGIDNVHSEFISHLGLQALEWLRLYLSDSLETSSIPKVWRKAKVIAILKPKKPADDPTSYRPISLLSIAYKLMERVILARIEDIVECHLPHAQA